MLSTENKQTPQPNNPDSQLNSYLTLQCTGNRTTEITHIHKSTDVMITGGSINLFSWSLSLPWMQLVRFSLDI